MEKIVRSAVNSIPDDPESSTYRFIIVAAKRARQLQGGARSFLPTTSRKPTVTSMEEVRRAHELWLQLRKHLLRRPVPLVRPWSVGVD